MDPENGLREQLANRLRATLGLGPSKSSHSAVVIGSEAEMFDRLADEVIRQMEWARHECDRIAENHWDGECPDGQACCVEHVRQVTASTPLTAAPPNWQP